MSHQNLWAPWRLDYLRSLDPAVKPPTAIDPPRCFLCDAAVAEAGSPEAKNRLVLLRDARGVIILNRYPYTNGHLLIAPIDHIGDLADLDSVQRNSLFELVALAEELLRSTINPQGINVGINIGRAAGAGVPGHLHVHVVPRWAGDVNFMETVGQIRVIPQALDQSYEHLAKEIQQISKQISK
ncbi:MAG: HIT domain-containing protein [Phycisphaeraceae bacterium]|nr:HIT domain-containing protein [Phycisphaeraceae bacterium]